ncbi:MAG: hypothetical protein NTU62_08555 [Spirochaetes bacterium]|nr:hypothetical protein [Spirochaetota bacterium]
MIHQVLLAVMCIPGAAVGSTPEPVRLETIPSMKLLVTGGAGRV